MNRSTSAQPAADAAAGRTPPADGTAALIGATSPTTVSAQTAAAIGATSPTTATSRTAALILATGGTTVTEATAANGVGTTEKYLRRLQERQAEEAAIYEREANALKNIDDPAEYERVNAGLRRLGLRTIPVSSQGGASN